MSRKKNLQTIGGLVNAKALEDLQQNFETMSILDAVDTIDEIRYRICEPEGLRSDLLRLHGLAHALINGDYTNASEKNGPIWELAEELESDIGEWADKLRAMSLMLDKLALLVPDEEYDDEDEEAGFG